MAGSRDTSGKTAAEASSAGHERVRIELSRAQVQQVLREAAGVRSLSNALGALEVGGQEAEIRDLIQSLAQLDERYMSRSLLVGLMVFAAFPNTGDVKLTDIARRLQLNTSTAHRYIATLEAVGLLERDPGTRRYRRVV